MMTSPEKKGTLRLITRSQSALFIACLFIGTSCGPGLHLRPPMAPAATTAYCGDSMCDSGEGCDCADCSTAPRCLPEADCGDTVDDDSDGDTDCADSDCVADAHCLPETNCTDTLDNDTDSLTDCADADCATDPSCIPESNCTDAVDNDLDSDTDCADSDCSADPACVPEANCADTLDDDSDGDTDCADSDCASDIACDADSDGSVLADDCDDTNASIYPGGVEVCGNAADDDCDGNTDSADSDCDAIVTAGLVYSIDADAIELGTSPQAECSDVTILHRRIAERYSRVSSSSNSCAAGSGWHGDGTSGDPYRLTLDGVNDRVLPVDNAGNPQRPLEESVTGTFTMELWAKPAETLTLTTEANTGISVTDNPFVVFPDGPHAYSLTENGVGIALGTNGVSVFEHQGSHFPSPLVFSGAIACWVHVSLVVTANDYALFLNGVKVRDGIASAGITMPSTSVGGGLYGYFGGDLATYRVYSAALSGAQVAANFDAQKARFDTSCFGTCGDTVCSAVENFNSCPADCTASCGNTFCETGENFGNCPADCPAVCGDSVCDTGENSNDCDADCDPVCNNGVCESGESFGTCNADCLGTDNDSDGETENGGDCDDADATRFSGNTEVCGDSIDQDCSGADLSCNDVDNDFDGLTENAGDCNDADGSIHPGATEVCGDSIDQDCAGGDVSCLDVDNDGDGQTENGGDCDDANNTAKSGNVETAAMCGNAVDEDCVGGDLDCNAVDNDGDGVTENGGDCDDTDINVYPGNGC